jgi:hypothetical protein
MIRKIIELLIAEEHYNKSELIEIAKGKNEIPTSFKKGFTQIKRIAKWQKI